MLNADEYTTLLPAFISLDCPKRHMLNISGLKHPSGSGSVVEHLLAKEGVASSNLVFRSIFLWRRGQVDKAGVCKTPIVGSIPTVASKSLHAFHGLASTWISAC